MGATRILLFAFVCVMVRKELTNICMVRGGSILSNTKN